MKNLILIAVQGAGKGTVAKALSEKYQYLHISTGDLLRERRLIDDEIGRIIAETQDTGVFTPAEIVYQVFEERLTQPDCENYILDGIPRSLEQAIEVDKILKKINKDDYLVINLTVPDEELISRITNRRSCGQCGQIYNIVNPRFKPKVDNTCDECQIELTFRDDDQDTEAIQTRINTYHENAKELIGYFQDKGVLVNIDSTDSKVAILEIEKLIL